MTRSIQIAYMLGCKLAELQSAEDLASAMVESTESDNYEGYSDVKDKTKMTGDSEFRNGDTWSHKIEIATPSNMGVPTR
jgi:hypothetical protein